MNRDRLSLVVDIVTLGSSLVTLIYYIICIVNKYI